MSPVARSSTTISPARARPSPTSSQTRWASSRASAWRHDGAGGRPAATDAAGPSPSCQLDGRVQGADRAVERWHLRRGGSRADARCPGVVAPCAQLLELDEALFEDGVYGLQQRRAAAEVERQREARVVRAKLVAALAEQPHVGVAKAVDRLELVADSQQVATIERAQDRQLAAIGVLELVDHQHVEALRPRRAHRLTLVQQLLREQLEVVEVHACPRALGSLVGEAEALQQLVEQRACACRLDVTRVRVDGQRRRQPRKPLSGAAQLEKDALEHRARAVDAVCREQVDGVGPLAVCDRAAFARPPIASV
jgi:hypothetical protein